MLSVLSRGSLPETGTGGANSVGMSDQEVYGFELGTCWKKNQNTTIREIDKFSLGRKLCQNCLLLPSKQGSVLKANKNGYTLFAFRVDHFFITITSLFKYILKILAPKNENIFCKRVHQGPVVQSVVSLTSSLRVISLTV